MTTVTPIPKKKKRKKSVRQRKIDACDKVCGQIVKSIGCCESGRETHNGRLEWAHGFGRELHAVRWDTRNSWALCHSCHFYFTLRPLLWDEWMRARLGDEEYDALRALALTHVEPDLDETLTELRELWQQIERSA